jgi:hypothetical protein
LAPAPAAFGLPPVPDSLAFEASAPAVVLGAASLDGVGFEREALQPLAASAATRHRTEQERNMTQHYTISACAPLASDRAVCTRRIAGGLPVCVVLPTQGTSINESQIQLCICTFYPQSFSRWAGQSDFIRHLSAGVAQCDAAQTSDSSV